MLCRLTLFCALLNAARGGDDQSREGRSSRGENITDGQVLSKEGRKCFI